MASNVNKIDFDSNLIYNNNISNNNKNNNKNYTYLDKNIEQKLDNNYQIDYSKSPNKQPTTNNVKDSNKNVNNNTKTENKETDNDFVGTIKKIIKTIGDFFGGVTELKNTGAKETGKTESIMKDGDNGQPPDYTEYVDTLFDPEVKKVEEKCAEIDKSIENMANDPQIATWDATHVIEDNPLYAEKERAEKDKNILWSEVNFKKRSTNKALKEIWYNDLQNSSDFDKFTTEYSVEELISMYKVLSYVSNNQYQVFKGYEDQIFEKDGKGSNILKEMYSRNYNGQPRDVLLEEDKISEEEWKSIQGMIDKGFTYSDFESLGDVFAKVVEYNKYMTQNEINIFNYLNGKYGNEAAEEYMKFLQDKFNSSMGAEQANEFLLKIDVNNPDFIDYLQTIIEGLGDGESNFYEGLNSALCGIDGQMSVSQYKTLYIINGLTEEQIDSLKGLTDKEKESLKGLKQNICLSGIYQGSMSFGNLIPVMYISAATSAINPVFSSITTKAIYGASIYGNAAESAYQQGNGYYESIAYGIFSGVSEIALEYFLGGNPTLSKGTELTGLKKWATQTLKEGGEEALQEVLDVGLRKIALGEDVELDYKQVLNAGVQGIIIGGILNGGSIVVNTGTSKVNISIDELLKCETETEMKQILKVKYGVDINNPSTMNYISQTNYNLTVDGETMTGLDYQRRLEGLKSEGYSEGEALNIMLDEFATKYEDKNWAPKQKIIDSTKEAYDKTKNIDNISYEDFLKIKFQINDPRTVLPNKYKILKNLVDKSDSAKIIWSPKDLSNLASSEGLFKNGIGRPANSNSKSSLFAIPSESYNQTFPKNLNNLSSYEQAKTLGDYTGLDSSPFASGAFEITVDKSYFEDNWDVSDPYTQGSNQLYVPGFQPTSDAYEIVISRIDDVVQDIDPDLQTQIDKFYKHGKYDEVSKMFLDGIENNKIKLKKGINIKRISGE